MAKRLREPAILLDNWAALDFKGVLSTRENDGEPAFAPDWMGPERRRVQGYCMMPCVSGGHGGGVVASPVTVTAPGHRGGRFSDRTRHVPALAAWGYDASSYAY
jgi:hypothetical protein